MAEITCISKYCDNCESRNVDVINTEVLEYRVRKAYIKATLKCNECNNYIQTVALVDRERYEKECAKSV